MSKTRWLLFIPALSLTLASQSVSPDLVAASPEPANLGIFDATADWGTAESPPMAGDVKVPGRVDVSVEAGAVVYDLYGNGGSPILSPEGNNRNPLSEEGFFVYTHKGGSWSLTAQVISDSTEIATGHFFGPMVRAEPRSATSEFYWPLCYDYATGIPGWDGLMKRSHGRNRYAESSWLHSFTNGHIRLTRIASKNGCFSEYSRDGENWLFDELHRVDLGSSPAYGLAISSGADTEELACRRFQNVKLEPAITTAFRHFNRQSFTPGEPFRVTLEVINSHQESRPITLVENLPDGWTAKEIGSDGAFEKQTITWALDVKPGTTTIHYVALSPDRTDITPSFDGTIGTIPIFGETSPILVSDRIAGQPVLHGRFWNSNHGLKETSCENLRFGPSGTVWVTHRNRFASGFDGFAFTQCPLTEAYCGVIETPSKLIWTQYMRSIDFFAPGSSWYIDEGRIAGFQAYDPGVADPIANRAIHVLEPFLTRHPGQYRSAAFDGDQIVVCFRDELLAYDIKTREITSLKDVKNTRLGFFYFTYIASNGNFWVIGREGIATIERVGGRFQPDSVWTEYSVDPSLPDHYWNQPREDVDGGLLFTAINRGDVKNQAIVRFKDGKWTKIYSYECPTNTTNKPFYSDRAFPFACLDAHGNVWIQHYASDSTVSPMAITRVNPNSKTVHPQRDELMGNINSLDATRERTIWIASTEGLLRFAPCTWQSPSNVSGVNNRILTIGQSPDGRMWFVTLEHLISFNGSDWSIHRTPKDISPLASTLAFLANGDLVLCGTKKWGSENSAVGLMHFDVKMKAFSFHNAPEKGYFFNAINTTSHRPIVFAQSCIEDFFHTRVAGQHVNELLEFVKYPLAFDGEDDQFHSIAYAGEDECWLSRDDTLYHYKEGQYGSFTKEAGFDVDYPKCLLSRQKGKVWIGCDQGIFEFDGERTTPVTTELGLVRDMIEAKDGSVWAASRSGVFRYLDGSWHKNDAEDGLPHDSVYTVYEDGEGRIWAGTAKGLSLYHPEADRERPRVSIPLERNARSTVGDAVQFVYEGKDKWDHTRAEHLVYSYRVDEGEWSSFTPDTVASVRGLPAGPHTFEVRAMDRNFNVSVTAAAFEFSVLLPWYREPVFLTIIAVGAITILILLRIAISRHLRLRHAYVRVQESEEELRETNDELHTANDRLLELDKMKSAFVSQASHDLRTPLTAIKGSLDNMLRGVGGIPNEKHQSLLGRAARSVDRLTILINDLLDVSRLESGRMVLEKSTVQFETLVQGIVHENQPAADQRGITLQAEGLSESSPIHIDGGKIERVVGELIGNAIKYTPEGGRVDIHLRRDIESLDLSVRDTGIGMTPEECEKIFDRFFRTRASQDMAKGSGLGLSIAKELVEMHGGTLTLHSEQGRGSTFAVSLPIAGEAPT